MEVGLVISNTHCAVCSAKVRRVFTSNSLPMLIELRPSSDGYIYVIGHSDIGTIVQVVGTPAEVPGNEPLRYLPHICHRVGHPRGGG